MSFKSIQLFSGMVAPNDSCSAYSYIPRDDSKHCPQKMFFSLFSLVKRIIVQSQKSGLIQAVTTSINTKKDCEALKYDT